MQKCAIAKLVWLHNLNPLDNVTDIFVFANYVAYNLANILYLFTTFKILIIVLKFPSMTGNDTTFLTF